MAFIFLVLLRDLAKNSLGPTSISIQLALHPLFLHVSESSSYSNFFRSWACSTCFSHGTIILFSLFCLKISIYLGVMMFEQYGLGILILPQNQPLIPSLLPMTVHMLWAFPFRLYFLLRGNIYPPENMCIRCDTKLYLMVRLQFWRSETCGV